MSFSSWYHKTPLVVLNLGAFISGCLLGLLFWKLGIVTGSDVYKRMVDVTVPFGNVLISMLKMVVIPIILFSLINGTASISLKHFGQMGLWVFGWYLLTSFIATVLGSGMALLWQPNLNNAKELAQKMITNVTLIRGSVSAGDSPMSIIYNLFKNPFEALGQGDFLPIIVFAILAGLSVRSLLDSSKDPTLLRQLKSMQDCSVAMQHVVFRLVDWVLCYFPIGVFCLTLGIFSTFGASLISSYFQVASCVILSMAVMLLGCYPLMIFLMTHENPYVILWRMRAPILTAFVTRSSAATLPISLCNAREKFKIRSELSSFALPLGATINMDGVCLHLPVFAVLAANLFGFQLGIGQIVMMIVSIVLASIGTGGVPGGSIFLLFMVLDCLHLSNSQATMVVGLALGINPLLDMFETACNVAGDNVVTYVVAHRLKMFEDSEPKL